MSQDAVSEKLCEDCGKKRDDYLHDASMPSVECHPFKEKFSIADLAGKAMAEAFNDDIENPKPPPPDLCLECDLEENIGSHINKGEEIGYHEYRTPRLNHDRKPETCFAEKYFNVEGMDRLATCYSVVDTCCPTHRTRTAHFHREELYIKKDETVVFQWDDEDAD